MVKWERQPARDQLKRGVESESLRINEGRDIRSGVNELFCSPRNEEAAAIAIAMTRRDHLQIRDTVPDDEICHCTDATSALLRYAMTEFPLYCATCTNQLFPDAFSLTEELAGKIVDWRTVFAALYDLWLDSHSYEEFAIAALEDPSGEVNRLGLSIASRLSVQRPTYYWWFRADPDVPVESCPVCSGALDPHATRDFAFCHSCRIAI